MSASETPRLPPDHFHRSGAFNQAYETLESLNRQRRADHLGRIGVSASLTQALYPPFLEQIMAHPAAAHALDELRHTRVLEVAEVQPGLPSRGLHPNGPLLNIHVQEHLSVTSAPYDFDWQWGNPISAVHQRSNGDISIKGGSGHVQQGSGDRVEAASGIGLAVTTTLPTRISVRPYIEYRWKSGVMASGLYSSGEARGGIDAAAFIDGQLVAGVRRSELFSDSRSWTGVSVQDGDGVAWVPDVTLEFDLEPGQLSVVNYGAWLECDHTSGIGVGGGIALIQARVRWVVVERFER
jgi:hypothetical protein